MPQNQVAYGQFDLDVDPAEGLGSPKDMQRKKYGAADARGYIRVRIWTAKMEIPPLCHSRDAAACVFAAGASAVGHCDAPLSSPR